MSKITADAAANLLAVFAGQSVTFDQAIAQMDVVYAMANKRPGFRSWFALEDELQRNGVTTAYTGPNYTGTLVLTFPN